MFQYFLNLVEILNWMLHVLFWYEDDEICEHPHLTQQIEPESVRDEADQAPEPEVTPRIDQNPEIVSEPEKESTFLLSDAPCSCKKPANTNIDHSMASEQPIVNTYVEMLEGEHKAMRYDIFEFQKKFEQLSIIITGLEGIQYENEELKEEVASMRATARAKEKQQQIIETQLKKDNSNLQKKLHAIENENKSLACKLSVLQRTEKQVIESNPQAANGSLQRRTGANCDLKLEVPDPQKSHLMESKTPLSERTVSLHETATEWHLHCQSEEFRHFSENTDLKKKMRILEEEHQNYIFSKTAELHLLTEDNRSLKVNFDLALETLNAKLNLLDDLKIELNDLKLKQQEEYTKQQGNDDLKELITSFQQTESNLNNDKKILKSRLQALYSKTRVVMDAKDAAEESLRQKEAITKEHLAAMDLLKSDLELANRNINENGHIYGRLKSELSDLKKITAALERQNKEMKQSMTTLEESVRKRISDWRISEQELRAEKDEISKKLGSLQTEKGKLLEKNCLVIRELELANEEIENLRETVAERELNLIECRNETKILRAETERMAESCKAALFSAQESEKLVEQHPASNKLFVTEEHQHSMKISAQRPFKSDLDIDIDHQSIEETCRLRAKLRGLEIEMENLRYEMAVKDRAEKELRKVIKELQKKNQLIMEKSEATIQSAQQAEQAAQDQVAVLSEALTALKEAVIDAKEDNKVEKNGESGTAENAPLNTMENKEGSKLKRWLKKRGFGQREVSLENESVNLVKNTASFMINWGQKAQIKGSRSVGKG